LSGTTQGIKIIQLEM